VIGDWTGTLATALAAQGCAVTRADPVPGPGGSPIDEEARSRRAGFDHRQPRHARYRQRSARRAAPCARWPRWPRDHELQRRGQPPALRSIMLAADGDRPARASIRSGCARRRAIAPALRLAAR
jgi:hypothetical protein